MIRIQGKLSRQLFVAVSGGVDSMAIVDFLKRNHEVHLVFVDHLTETSKTARKFLTEYTKSNGLALDLHEIGAVKNPKESTEEYWRNERYKVFHNYENPIITCHHLDDCVETWVWSSLHGEGKIIPYQNKNVIRPFRLTKKKDLKRWAKNNNVPWVEDESNNDVNYMRNYIRHEMMPHVLKINPGIQKVIAKKVTDDLTT